MVAEGYRRRFLQGRGSLRREAVIRSDFFNDDLWRYSRKYGDAWFLPKLLFHSDRLGVWKFLYCDSERLLETLLAGDREGFKSLIDAAVKRAVDEFHREVDDFKRELESSLDKFEEFHSKLVKDIRAVDGIISDVPQVTRDGLTFRVDGKIARYEVDLLSGDVSAICAGGHTKEHICIRADGDIDEIGARGINNNLIRRSIQIALNLVNDDECDIEEAFNGFLRVVMCPWCFREGRTSREAVDALLVALGMREKCHRVFLA